MASGLFDGLFINGTLSDSLLTAATWTYQVTSALTLALLASSLLLVLLFALVDGVWCHSTRRNADAWVENLRSGLLQDRRGISSLSVTYGTEPQRHTLFARPPCRSG